MLGKRQERRRKSGTVVEYGYECSSYGKSGTSACTGYLLRERDVITVVVPIFRELVQTNLREHLKKVSTVNPLHSRIEGEIKAELAKIKEEQ